ncbi:GntR family transcriptional regulator [Tropicimonas aquimaris]|uniref:GntR family transcriptional regulator n=1 Tax=Tropicimonas aquimaris TaxID=914152 RepID=A0ABW3IN51_9RHOB
MQERAGKLSTLPEPTPTISELLVGVRLDPEKNITFQVFDILRDLIVSVKLRPGQRLSEKEIAAALSASKTPVREAMIRLDEIRLVKIVPQSGTYVTKISVKRYRTACFIRLQLELGAVRAAACSPNAKLGLKILDRMLAQQAKAVASEDYESLFRLDEGFHFQLFEMAGFGDAWTTARRTQFDVNRARHVRRLHGVVNGPEILAEHSAIVEAIRAQDPDRAEAALRAHIGDLEQQISVLFRDKAMLGTIEAPEDD